MIIVVIVGLVIAWLVHAQDVLLNEESGMGTITILMESACFLFFCLIFVSNYLHDSIFKRRE